jgi:hypothetical protein
MQQKLADGTRSSRSEHINHTKTPIFAVIKHMQADQYLALQNFESSFELHYSPCTIKHE